MIQNFVIRYEDWDSYNTESREEAIKMKAEGYTKWDDKNGWTK